MLKQMLFRNITILAFTMSAGTSKFPVCTSQEDKMIVSSVAAAVVDSICKGQMCKPMALI